MGPRLPSWLALLCALGGCSTRAEPPAVEVLSVFAASSLREAFGAVEQAFERRAPAVDVQLSFAGSQVLRMQIEQGARAGVFASAHVEHVQALTARGLMDDARGFADNALALVVRPSAPLQRFDQLPQAARVVLGTPQVPVGRYARQLLERADAVLGPGFAQAVRAHVVSEESNVRLVRAKVELGEADAALVYATDAIASDAVRRVPIPDAVNVRASYAIAATRGAQHALAIRFIDFVRSREGQRILREHGLSPVPVS